MELEAETSNIPIKVKGQLKVVQMLKMLVHDNTDLIKNESVKPKPFTNVNRPRSNLNPSSPKFCVPSNMNLIHKP